MSNNYNVSKEVYSHVTLIAIKLDALLVHIIGVTIYMTNQRTVYKHRLTITPNTTPDILMSVFVLALLWSQFVLIRQTNSIQKGDFMQINRKRYTAIQSHIILISYHVTSILTGTGYCTSSTRTLYCVVRGFSRRD